MDRAAFEHVLAAAGDATGLDAFVVIGSQAILGQLVEPPAALLASMEVDLYPLADPARAEDIDGAIGDGSAFERTFGYFAHGVGPETAVAPAGWMERLITVEIPARVAGKPVVAHCIERHDLVLAKLVRGSERDVDYARAAVKAKVVEVTTLAERVPDLPVDSPTQARVGTLVAALG